MLDLVLGVFFFNLILILFKLFERYNVDNLQAIIINYLVAGSCGLVFGSAKTNFSEITTASWFPLALVIGLLFIVVFNLLAKGTQKVGIAMATVANKMSVILPVIASFFLYGDQASWLKITGIVLALAGVILNAVSNGKLGFDKKYLPLILVIFLGQGLADILFNYAQHHHVSQPEAELFIAILFLAAFITGMVMLVSRVIAKKETVKIKNVLWGVALGVPNYLTLFYFFKSLENGFMESSQVYPIFNIGVILLSAFSGLLFFREKLSFINWLGIFLSVLAIAAIGFG